MLTATTERVREHTLRHVNEDIRRETAESITRHRNAGSAAIDRRLDELDHEWDIERTLEANAATVALTGSVLAATVNRKWAFLPMAVAGFLLQHAIQGWCPPVPVFRRLGFRTQREIDHERTALKLLRGDFRGTTDGRVSTEDLLRAVEA